MAEKLGNPAVVGLAGFGGTTLLLQFHNLGWCGVGPVVWVGLVFGGIMQMIAGFQEQKTGNNFGYCAFSSYGAFWISLGLIFIGNFYGIYKASTTDVGWFLFMWTIYTFIMWIGSMRTNSMLTLVFLFLLAGFVFLDLAHFTPSKDLWTKVAGWDLIICALAAWYVMAHNIFLDLWGKDILPVGKPWISK